MTKTLIARVLTGSCPNHSAASQGDTYVRPWAIERYIPKPPLTAEQQFQRSVLIALKRTALRLTSRAVRQCESALEWAESVGTPSAWALAEALVVRARAEHDYANRVASFNHRSL